MWHFIAIYLYLFAIIYSVTVTSCSESLVVNIEQGRLRGFRYSESNFFTFMSVPYATAPPGTDRFKAPLPAPVWMQTFDAVETGKVCPQFLPLPKIREDCLLANIFVPDTNVTNLPVMVYVHSGAYVCASGDYFRFTQLVDTKKLIVITFNYRLGVHGFLCLGTKDVPGNAGIKDQIALLRWVKRNIASFGGNPDDVTVAGCSSSGGAIDLLTLSPMATGLFQKAIIESGASLGLSGVQLDPINNAKMYAKALNFSDYDNITALEHFYKTASYELLTSRTDDIIYRDDSTTLFGPCIERDTGTGEEMFLSESPWAILKRGTYKRIPLLYGYSEMDGLDQIENFDKIVQSMNENFVKFLPGNLQFDSNEEKNAVAKEVKNFYFGDELICEETILGYIKYFTDILIVFPMIRSLNMRLAAGNATVYMFEYSFVDNHTDFIPYTSIRAAGHCSHIKPIKDTNFTNKTVEYIAMLKTMRELWLNFIIHGKPVPEGSTYPEWPPIGPTWSPHMAINDSIPEMKQFLPLKDRAMFWFELYRKYQKIPIPPTYASSVMCINRYFITVMLFCMLIIL